MNPWFNYQFIPNDANIICLLLILACLCKLRDNNGQNFCSHISKLTMACHKIEVYFIIKNCWNLAAEKWFRYLADCEILLNTNKLDLMIYQQFYTDSSRKKWSKRVLGPWRKSDMHRQCCSHMYQRNSLYLRCYC